MSAYRENLVDRLIRIYGLENPIVIEFCRYCGKQGGKEND